MLSGEPGIGKTRLADEIAQRAERAGARVLWGRSWETGGAPAFWPWVQMFRAYGAEISDAELREVIGSATEQVAVIVPELAQRLGHATPRSTFVFDQSRHARFAQFDAVVGCVARAATRRPLALVFEDLHAADLPSLLLLQFLCAARIDVPLLLVGTHREAELRRRPDAARILLDVAHGGVPLPLRGLTEEEIVEFVSDGFGVRVDTKTAAALRGATDGNPFLLGELARVSMVGHRIDHLGLGADARMLSTRARDFARRWLELVPDVGKRSLRIASLIGQEFGVRTLAETANLSEDEAIEHLREAVADGLVVADAHARTRFHFRHALIREAIADDLTLAERITLHRAIGEAVEAQHQELLEPYFDILAHHFVRAAPGGGWERGVRYARAAGEQALARLAYEEAAVHFEGALSALDLADRPIDVERCELQLALGTSHQRSGDVETARHVLGEAASIARALGRVDLLARIAMAYEPWTAYGRTTDSGVRLLEEALVGQPEGDGALRAELLGHLAHVLGGAGGDRAQGRAIAVGQEAVAMARRLGEKRTLARALNGTRWVDWDFGSFGERVAMADEMASLATELRDPELALLAEGWRFVDRVELGDVAGAQVALGRHAALCVELKQPEHHWWNTVWRAGLAVAEGRFVDAEALCGQALELGQRVSVENSLLVCQMQLGQVMIERGRAEDALVGFDAFIAERVEAFEADPSVGCRRTQLLVDLGHRIEARREFERIASDAFVALTPDIPYALNLAALTIACAFLDDEKRAAVLYRRLAPAAGRNLMLGPAITFVGPSARFRGLLAATMRRQDLARRHFEDALVMSRRMGWLPSVAHTLCDYAEVLLRRGGKRSLRPAKTMLEEALEIAERLGMVLVVQRARRLLDRDASESTLSQSPSYVTTNVCHCEGEYWTLSYAASTCRVRHSTGLRYLAELLRSPGREIRALELVGAVNLDPSLQTHDVGSDLSVRISDEGADLLDPAARTTYRERLREIGVELDEAERRNDPGHVHRLRAERDAVEAELARAVGLGGRARRTPGAAERARLNVTRAIKTAIARIDACHPELGRHLARRIRTGAVCAYLPDPRVAIAWSVRTVLGLLACIPDLELGISDLGLLDPGLWVPGV